MPNYARNCGPVIERVLQIVREAGPAGISTRDLVGRVYEDDPEGGPLDAYGVVKVTVCRLRKRGLLAPNHVPTWGCKIKAKEYRNHGAAINEVHAEPA